MPYKDPERKRQWEQKHREERNARRRKQPLTVPYRVHDPLSLRESTARLESRSGNWGFGTRGRDGTSGSVERRV